MSLCNYSLTELSNPGASGSIFYISDDDEFIVKTVQHKEADFLQKLLPGYYMVNCQSPDDFNQSIKNLPKWQTDTARTAPCGLRGCKNGPALFPGRMSHKATKPGLVCLSYHSIFYCVVVYYGPFLCIVSFHWLERPLWAVESSPLQFLALA